MKKWFSVRSHLVMIIICIIWIILFSFSGLNDFKILTWFVVSVLPFLIMGYYFFFDSDRFLYLTIFFIPLSSKLDLPAGISVSFPSEIMVVIILAYVVFNSKTIRIPDRRIFYHPIFILLLGFLGWMIISSAWSEIPVVAFKRTFIQTLFFFVFYFLFLTKFDNTKNIIRFYIAYSLGMLIPIVNGLIWHSQYNFNPQASYIMPRPFFIEHTIYAASIAFLIPMLFYFNFFTGNAFFTRRNKSFLLMILICCLVGEYFAFSRAAWLSLILLPLFLLIIKLKVRKSYLLAGSLIIIFFLLTNIGSIVKLGFITRNESQSNKGSVRQQIESVSNIHSDISNLERINRWKCAVRMFEARPFTGYGPGTYQFIYGGFQVKSEMTPISTYNGEKGNAHSEYLGFLAESGFPGFIIYICLIIAVISTSLKVIYKTNDKEIRNLTIAILLSLLTFYFHTLFNGFLETDKIGSLYFGSLAALTGIDVYFLKDKPI